MAIPKWNSRAVKYNSKFYTITLNNNNFYNFILKKHDFHHKLSYDDKNRWKYANNIIKKILQSYSNKDTKLSREVKAKK